ncbi:hypothetical protein ACH4YO_08010 [Streptomyces noursei]|uniref:hypothetical protein n=1 Tax=Streptomyces noursei TaxID=1971 RepID=UPI00340EAC24
MSKRQVWEVIVPDEDGREYVYRMDTLPLMSERTVGHQMWLKHCRDGGDADPRFVKAARLHVEEVSV